MTKPLMLFLVLLLAGCLSSSGKFVPVVRTAVRLTDVSPAAALDQAGAFLASRGYARRFSSANQNHFGFALGDTWVQLDAAPGNCVNFTVLIPDGSRKFQEAQRISEGFYSNFHGARGWQLARDDVCVDSPNKSFKPTPLRGSA